MLVDVDISFADTVAPPLAGGTDTWHEVDGSGAIVVDTAGIGFTLLLPQ